MGVQTRVAARDRSVSRREGVFAMPDRRTFILALSMLLVGCVSQGGDDGGTGPSRQTAPAAGTSPGPPRPNAHDALIDAVERRRSVRAFTGEPVRDEDVALMLWAAQGVTDARRGLRAAPSAGALYPLEVYVASAEGLSRYIPGRDEMRRTSGDDVRQALALAALGQSFIAQAPVVFVITGVYSRTAGKYGTRAERYVHLEAGHAAQNILLVATRLGLGGTPVGAFSDDAVRGVLGADDGETPLYVMPVGHPA